MNYEIDISPVVPDDAAAPVPETKVGTIVPHRRNGEAEPESTGVVAPTTTTEDDVTPTTGHTVTPVAESETVEPAYVNDVITIDETELHSTGAGSVSSAPSAQVATQMFATIDEVADLLRLERKAVYRLAQRGELPGCRRLGHSFRVHVPSVLQWFASGLRTDRKRGKSR